MRRAVPCKLRETVESNNLNALFKRRYLFIRRRDLNNWALACCFTLNAPHAFYRLFYWVELRLYCPAVNAFIFRRGEIKQFFKLVCIAAYAGIAIFVSYLSYTFIL